MTSFAASYVAKVAEITARVKGRLKPLVVPLVDGRTLRALAPAVVPLVLFLWIWHQVEKELQSPLFRDPTLCQYTAWCMRNGVRLYSEIGQPDGPFIYFLHALIQTFVGVSDAGFRKADLCVQIFGSGLMGAALAPKFALNRATQVLQRLAWAGLAVALWMTWYLPLGWAQTLQRDSYYSLLGYLGLVLLYASAYFSPRFASLSAFAGAFLCAVMLFTRHSGLICVGAGVLTVLLADREEEQRLRRRKAALAGVVAGLVVMLLTIALVGSLRGFWFWYFRFPFGMYRFVAAQNSTKLLLEGFQPAALIGVLAAIGVFGAIAVKALPRRAAGFGAAPILFLVAASLAAKGWSNHIQQVTSAVVPLSLLLLSALWSHRADRLRWASSHMALAALSLTFIGYKAMQSLEEGYYARLDLPEPVNPDVERGKAVGAYLREHTHPEDKVFFYGYELHSLLVAERRPAVPYSYDGLLAIDLLLARYPAVPEKRPTEAQVAAIHRMQLEILADTCPRLAANPPAAMVFADDALGGMPVQTVSDLCPAIPALLRARYAEMPANVARYHVYLRDDRR